MSFETPGLINEARRQIEICNACRYCEGFCAVFPAMTRNTDFAAGDLSHLANLCHNCRGCSYSCQYTEPHEFALNVPAILAEVRQDSWERHIRPAALARAFHSRGVAIMGLMVLVIAVFFYAARSGGEGSFYAVFSHNTLVALFLPAFVLPLLSVALGLRSYWRETGGRRITPGDLKGAFASVAVMKNLAGGHGEGCNFEKENRYSQRRRFSHQAIMYGFLLCFAATGIATLMHYLLDMPAPYGLLSPPKLLGIPGGILMVLGGVDMILSKLKADPTLGAQRVWGGEMAFVALLVAVAASGLALYAATGSTLMPGLLALHLGTVLTLFLLLPFSKMVHGFFRLAALIVEQQKKRG
ncbi:tricarballylate utilization 4Fe-4S protein TcuB [Falsigemmobacter faecalis]|uniref:Tricarballylate utilization 4Fe-4S protein TcuB n=1 Tax=Falsigemmobacter faecalis TaxID=2488730 RepID=A0A3P3DK90_9RHOB|nr:tricarballylate utilization 4Fe-4S protein TcuB [Falsigemmobacter faecalis]RRH73028.1 tricarballylate utilization 4Fe-4S protein TcuB [Falsigemmobacter faecalis]